VQASDPAWLRGSALVPRERRPGAHARARSRDLATSATPPVSAPVESASLSEAPIHPGRLRCSPVEWSGQSPPSSRRASPAPRRPDWQTRFDQSPPPARGLAGGTLPAGASTLDYT